MNCRRLLYLIAASITVLGACGQPDAATVRGLARAGDSTALGDPESAVRRLVTLFGARMQTGSLLVPDSIAASRLQEAYGTLVTPDLLSDWMARPTLAPGRRVSSPWPDHIEVESVKSAGSDEYLVTGALVYESSAPGKSTSRGTAKPVRLHVRRAGDGSWRISLYEPQAAAGDRS